MSQQAGHGLPDPLPDMDAATSLYRVAFEEGRRSISDQVDELNGIRTRAVSYMAFIGTATAFLVTTTLRSAAPGGLFYVVAILATLSVAWATVQLCRVIRPGLDFTIRLDPRDIITNFIDRQVPRPSEAQLLRSLAGWSGRYIDDNDNALEEIRRRFSHVILFGGGGLLLWTIAVWLFGRVGVGG
ncbi:hypothetical protein ACTWLI_07650 [Arthrobacter sp. Hor0625]|uniref:hypothetical protein n=1 Tax=Arthrobacter sp. Hor0625 TaxID=3457358 RepID=UPI00403E6B40